MRNGLKTSAKTAPHARTAVHGVDLELRVRPAEDANNELDSHLTEARANAQAILKVVERDGARRLA